MKKPRPPPSSTPTLQHHPYWLTTVQVPEWLNALPSPNLHSNYINKWIGIVQQFVAWLLQWTQLCYSLCRVISKITITRHSWSLVTFFWTEYYKYECPYMYILHEYYLRFLPENLHRVCVCAQIIVRRVYGIWWLINVVDQRWCHYNMFACFHDLYQFSCTRLLWDVWSERYNGFDEFAPFWFMAMVMAF